MRVATTTGRPCAFHPNQGEHCVLRGSPLRSPQTSPFNSSPFARNGDINPKVFSVAFRRHPPSPGRTICGVDFTSLLEQNPKRNLLGGTWRSVEQRPMLEANPWMKMNAHAHVNSLEIVITLEAIHAHMLEVDQGEAHARQWFSGCRWKEHTRMH